MVEESIVYYCIGKFCFLNIKQTGNLVSSRTLYEHNFHYYGLSFDGENRPNLAPCCFSSFFFGALFLVWSMSVQIIYLYCVFLPHLMTFQTLLITFRKSRKTRGRRHNLRLELGQRFATQENLKVLTFQKQSIHDFQASSLYLPILVNELVCEIIKVHHFFLNEWKIAFRHV